MTTKTATTLGLLLVALLGATTAGSLLIRQQSLPVYAEGELPPSGGYANNTLALGDITYISGKSEFRLRPLGQPLGLAWPVGQTADGVLKIYRLSGRGRADYIYATGEMMPQTVYRNSRVAPLDLRDMVVPEIRYAAGGSSAPKASRDASLISEVMSSLIAQQSVVLRPDYNGGDQNHRLDLVPEQAPGLAYAVDTLVTKSGQVYLSTQSELGREAWTPAGPLFTRWVRP